MHLPISAMALSTKIPEGCDKLSGPSQLHKCTIRTRGLAVCVADNQASVHLVGQVS